MSVQPEVKTVAKECRAWLSSHDVQFKSCQCHPDVHGGFIAIEVPLDKVFFVRIGLKKIAGDTRILVVKQDDQN